MMYISNKVMCAILRHYKEKEFGIIDFRLDSKGIAIYKLKFYENDNDSEIEKEIYIQYDHEDKEFFSRIVEI